MDIRSTIVPTEKEQRVFDTLLEASQAAGRKTILRVAGGWVRDKLMGLESHDIDVALDDISGSDFAELVRAHVQGKGEKASRVGRIQANPAQSKHLETATMRICDIAIDFVNLRSERYAEGSRIPTVEIGTPEEDASRRDLTINALFYNINTGEVEDFTGQGLADLRSRLIRTPLAPSTTFLDDPLRVLRTLRFATRYGFSLDPALIDAASTPEVRDALGAKVSRERVGTELSNTLHGPRPAAALILLYQLRLWNVVFSLPAQPATLGDPDRAAKLVASVARACAAVTGVCEAPMPGAPSFASTGSGVAPASPAASMVAPAAHDNLHAIMLLATALAPIAGNTVPLRKGRTEGAPKHVVLSALKLRTRDADDVELTVRTASNVSALVAGPDRLRTGLFVREAGRLWPAALLVGLALREDVAAADGGVPSMVAAAEDFCARVREWRLESVWQEKPLLNGKTLIAEVGVPKGPSVGVATQRVIEWQILHRDGDAAQCAEYMRSLGAAAYSKGGGRASGAAQSS